MSTNLGDVGTTSPTVPARQQPPPRQSKYRFASLQHHSLTIARALAVLTLSYGIRQHDIVMYKHGDINRDVSSGLFSGARENMLPQCEHNASN